MEDKEKCGNKVKEGQMFYEEIGVLNFGDKRLNRRLMMIGERIGRRIHSLISSLFATKAEREGAYRFFSNKKVTVETLKKPMQTL
jgi:hypothetical protein